MGCCGYVGGLGVSGVRGCGWGGAVGVLQAAVGGEDDGWVNQVWFGLVWLVYV